jgi:hypothetical protein
MASAGNLWVAGAYRMINGALRNEVALSLDGANWRFQRSRDAKGVAGAESQLLAFSNDNVYPGPLFGLSPDVVT